MPFVSRHELQGRLLSRSARADLERAATRLRDELAAALAHGALLAATHDPVVQCREHEVPAVLAMDYARGCCVVAHGTGAYLCDITCLSAHLQDLDAVAVGVGDPAESTDTLHVQRLASHVRSLGAQLCEHRFRVADPEVDRARCMTAISLGAKTTRLRESDRH